MASELKQKTIKGLAWNSIQNFSNRGIEFLLMLFMARLLSPKEYGIIGLTSIFMTFASTFIDSGFANALIRKKNTTNEDYSTVFFFNNLISLICYSFVFFIAPWVARFYNIPVLCPVLRVLGFQIIIQGLCSVQNTILKKNLNFKKRAKISITRNIVSGFVGLFFAWNGFGVWALVIQALTASFISTLLLWSTTKWHPSLLFSKKSFQELFGYGSKLLASSLINNIYSEIYPIVIGKIFSPSILGHYSRARHWAKFPSANLTGILQNVTFPVLAKVQDDNQLSDIYRRMIKTSCFIVFPLMIGLSAIAKPLILFTIGEKWEFCSTLLQIICFSMVWHPLHSLNLNLLQVKGRSDLFLKLEIIKKILGIIILCVSIPLGIVAMCYFSILSSLISLFINTYYTGKLINVGFLKQMRDITPTLLLSMIMFAAVSIFVHIVNNIYIQLVVGILLGATIYLGCSYLLKFQELKEVLVMYKDIKNRNK
ncbi:MAG: lipopolysaccharide biosynthesis protein [Prevotella sp.]|nr:lipopolysaccharide biosynthesis protein [Prevotella sp.]MEE3414490.1 lipopolysaccharide biosynthesis protein [Prevotella sp.]